MDAEITISVITAIIDATVTDIHRPKLPCHLSNTSYQWRVLIKVINRHKYYGANTTTTTTDNNNNNNNDNNNKIHVYPAIRS